MNRDILPCPFCGSKDIWERSVWQRNPVTGEAAHIYHVECGHCGGRTTIRSTAEKAAAAWNQRALPKETTEQTVRIDAALAAQNEELARLEAEVRELKAMKVWQPVEEETISTSHPDGDGIGTTVTTECAPELWGSRQSIQIWTWDGSGPYYASIVLPDDIRLCRRVEE